MATPHWGGLVRVSDVEQGLLAPPAKVVLIARPQGRADVRAAQRSDPQRQRRDTPYCYG